MIEQRWTRRGFLGSSGAAMLGGLASQVAGQSGVGERGSTEAPQEQRHKPTHSQPNLILFMPDELRADALACYGNPLTRTPNFDKLAQRQARAGRNAIRELPRTVPCLWRLTL